MALSSEAPSDAPPVAAASPAERPLQSLRGSGWRALTLRWRPLLLVLSSLIGCQAMAASRQITAPVAVVFPRGLEGARQAFLQGLTLGEQAVRACGATPAPLMLHGLGWDGDPRVLFPTNGDGQPVLPSLLVAPYAADLRTYIQLAQDGDARVLLAHQRGASLAGLPGLDDQGRLWPLLPSREDDLRALAQATMDRGWKRVMVVSDPASKEGDWAAAFVTLFEGMGGQVLSYTQEKVQELEGTDSERMALLQKDVDWLGPDAMVLAAAPKGPLAGLLSQRQRQQGDGARPAWVWLISQAQTVDVAPHSWPQLVLDAPAHGPGWADFAKGFQQRWGYAPDLIAAAGYETARVLALTTAGPVPLASDGTQDPLAWVNPTADPLPLCQAIARRRKGEAVRVKGVASDFALRPGLAPTGVASSRLIAPR